ncbi:MULTISPECIES: hypothetical protein [Paenibacillus]|uniref:Uncharacterized protein n=1 Tax=Paenibacillus naphthalenovorans TaxID=162209 RepID=A0A0U2UHG5_9BACL|nr:MULTISPECIES: hypothetical protein [Paenibacillus]ALS22604.1 hypothetical protein IJ22_22300 [Paenibacillus naphthalenovorans]NTZ17781.1 hypothetical protein [Paenibacillus sp. JMULE4]GCL70400.1 hypothetical protein PN4B1_03000 [Paenibacillus naphthalenovorans]SDH83470.1 hypothetical protein SAMN05421868_101264 [Paenibacillus naphthalenovorans]
MWESVLKKDQLELQMNSNDKSIRFRVSEQKETAERIELELNQSEMFELLHAFLTINRSFNKETMYYDEAVQA